MSFQIKLIESTGKNLVTIYWPIVVSLFVWNNTFDKKTFLQSLYKNKINDIHRIHFQLLAITDSQVMHKYPDYILQNKIKELFNKLFYSTFQLLVGCSTYLSVYVCLCPFQWICFKNQ